MADTTFILVAVADNEPARALVENLMEGMGGKVVDMVSAESDVVEIQGYPAIKWDEDYLND